MSQRTKIEWKGSNGRVYGKYVTPGQEAQTYRTVLERTILDYEKLLLKYAPDWKQQRQAEIERLAHKKTGGAS